MTQPMYQTRPGCCMLAKELCVEDEKQFLYDSPLKTVVMINVSHGKYYLNTRE